MFKVLESPGKISFKIMHFHRLKWKTSSNSSITHSVLTVAYLNTAYNNSNFFDSLA